MDNPYTTLLISYLWLPKATPKKRHIHARVTANKLIHKQTDQKIINHLKSYSFLVSQKEYKRASLFITKLRELYLE